MPEVPGTSEPQPQQNNPMRDIANWPVVATGKVEGGTVEFLRPPEDIGQVPEGEPGAVGGAPSGGQPLIDVGERPTPTIQQLISFSPDEIDPQNTASNAYLEALTNARINEKTRAIEAMMAAERTQARAQAMQAQPAGAGSSQSAQEGPQQPQGEAQGAGQGDAKPKGDVSVAGDIARQIPSGIAQAGINTMQGVIETVTRLADMGGGASPDPKAKALNDYIREETKRLATEYSPSEAQTIPGGLARGLAQFATGFIPAMAGLRALGAGVSGAGALAGVVTDLSVWSRADQNLSNLIEQYAPTLSNPFTRFMAVKGDDSEAAARFKQAAEGVLVGGVVGQIIKAGRAIKAAKAMSDREMKALGQARMFPGERVIGPLSPGEANAIGLMSDKQYDIYRRIEAVNPELSRRTTVDIMDTVRVATEDEIASYGGAMNPKSGVIVAGQTVTHLEDDTLKTIITLYQGADATTFVEEAAHRYWDHLPRAQQALYEEYYRTQYVGNLPITEVYAGEATQYFFKKRMDKTLAENATAYQRAKNWALNVAGRAMDHIEGIKVPPEIESMYRAAFEAGELPQGGMGGTSYQLKSLPGGNLRGVSTVTPGYPEFDAAIKAEQQAYFESELAKRLGDPEGPYVYGAELLQQGRELAERGADDAIKNLDPGARMARAMTGQGTVNDWPKYVGNINFNRINSTDDIKAVLAEMVNLAGPELDAARRGVQTQAMIKADAEALGLTVESLLSRRQGQAFNAAEAVAARQLMLDSARALRELASEVLVFGSNEAKIAFQKQMAVHYAVQAQVQGMTAEAGRALASFRIMASEANALGDMSSIIKAAERGGKDTAKIAQALLEQQFLGNFNRAARSAWRAKTWDMVMEVWINSILSGPITHAVNITSNAMNTFWQLPERMVAAEIGRITGGPQTIKEREALALAFGMVEGLKDGLRLAGKSLSRGTLEDWQTVSGILKGNGDWASVGKALKNILAEPTVSEGVGKTEGRVRRAITGETLANIDNPVMNKMRAISPQSLEAGGWLARGMDVLGQTVRVPGRFLEAEDDFFKAVLYRMELNAQSMRVAMDEASEQGLKGSAKNAFVARRLEELRAEPETNFPELHMAAMDAARYGTFTNELGKFGQSVQRLQSAAPWMRLILPFVRTPANIMKATASRTPLALVSPSFWRDVNAGGAKRDLALARVSLGTAIGLVAAYETMQGNITGSGPPDPRQKSVLRADGVLDYSFKVNGDYYQYGRLEPLGSIVGLWANGAEIINRSWGNNTMSGVDVAAAIAIATARYFVSRAYFQGMGNLLDAINQPASMSEDPAKIAKSTLSRYLQRQLVSFMPASGLMRTITRQVDPTKREINGLWDAIKAQTPFASLSLMPTRNIITGTPMIHERWGPDVVSPIAMSTGKDNKVLEELARVGVRVDWPGKYVSLAGTKLELDPVQYDKMLVLMSRGKINGRTLEESLGSLMGTTAYRKASIGPDGGKAAFIHHTISRYTEWARAQLLRSDGGALMHQLSAMAKADQAKKFKGAGIQ